MKGFNNRTVEIDAQAELGRGTLARRIETITDGLPNIPAFFCDVRWPQCSLRQVHPDK